MIAPAWRPGQRTLDVALALVGAAILATLIGYETLGARTALWITTGLTFTLAAIGAAGVALHRPPKQTGWRLGVWAIVAVGVGDTILLATNNPRASIDVYPPTMLFYLVGYALGVWALVRHTRLWSRWHRMATLVDSATLTTAMLTVFGTFAYQQLRNPSITAESRLMAVLLPTLDLILVAVIARMWFSPSGRVAAFRIIAVAPIFLVAEHSLDVLWISNARPIHPAFTQLWILMMFGIALAATRRSSCDQNLDAPRVSMEISLIQAVTLAVRLFIPTAVMVAYGLAGEPIPWVPISAGALLMAGLVTVRVALLVREVRLQTSRAELLARSDPLTGTANRRRWDAALEEQVLASLDGGSPFWMALIDIDHFKAFNDTHGHQAGDRLLRAAASGWGRCLREGELLARYGGEEFAVLLPELTRNEAVARTERLRAAVPMAQTCSVGLAPWAPGVSIDALTGQADAALYEAKRRGRNRVVVHGEDPRTQPVRP